MSTEPTLFVIILRYVVPIAEIDAHRPTHLAFLDEGYAKGVFLASGRQNPVNGGVILARARTRKELWGYMQRDPFYIHELAEFQIFEFQPNKYADELKELMGKLSEIAA